MEFQLSEKEEKAVKDFEEKHNHPEVNKGAIGGHIQYTFIPTSLANICVLKCSICGEEQNITDYDSW